MQSGIWNEKNAVHHQTSQKLVMWIGSKMIDKYCASFCDFGAGNGYYVNELLKRGFHGIGIEGNPSGIKFPVNIFIGDLAERIFLHHDVSISLEVGEHLPKEAQDDFMENVCLSANKMLILSWAEIGQPGIGHINCRSQEDVIADVEGRGFYLDREATTEARENIDDNCDWFRRTLLIFLKK